MTVTYTRPSYPELQARIGGDFSGVPKVLANPIAASWGRACHGIHGHLDWVDRQSSPITCELERLYDWAALYGVDRLAATAAVGTAPITGNPGTTLLADTVLRGQNGFDFTVTAAITMSGVGTGAASLKCLSTGLATNMLAGQTLTLVDPVPGINSTVTLSAPLTGGADDELVDDWRIRVSDEWQVVVTRGARSGKPDDYRQWAKNAHPSVSGALVQLHALGTGTVLVRPICNALANRQPTVAVLDAVSAYFFTIAPATADWRLAAPITHAVPVSLHLLPGYDTAQNRANIEAAISALVLAEMSETASIAMGELDAAIATVTTQYTRLAPLADVSVAAGEVFTFGAVTWS